MRHWINFPRIEGKTSRQAHCDLPEDTYEREFGREGFFGPVTHFYHAHPPTGWTSWEGDLKPRAFDLVKLHHEVNSPWQATPILHNASLRLRLWQAQGAMDHLACNADGDELLFVHSGKGNIYCDFGHLEFREGDYILLPRGTRWRCETK